MPFVGTPCFPRMAGTLVRFNVQVIGAAGFAPTTSASQAQRSTKLSYAPMCVLKVRPADPLSVPLGRAGVNPAPTKRVAGH